VDDSEPPAGIADLEGATRRTSRAIQPPRDLTGLGDVAQSIFADIAPLVDRVIERLRCDSTLTMGAGLRTSQVADHLSTLIADIAGSLRVVEDAGPEPVSLLADAMEIQRLIAERHGAQRAGLGWTEASMRREYMIIREELERLVRGAVPADGPLDAADAVAIVNRFLDQAEYISVRALEKARGV
jgi:hypothetical protein